MVEKEEIVFEIGGEGGAIQIIRVRSQSGEKFIYHHNEFDPTDEGLDVNFKDEYSNFERPFQLINNRYPWFSLCLMTIHEDYIHYIIEELIKRLNNEHVPLSNLEHSKHELEFSLKIKLNCSTDNDPDTVNWSYSKANIG